MKSETLSEQQRCKMLVRTMCEQLEDDDTGATTWEIDFVQSLEHRDHYTEKQAAKIDEVYERWVDEGIL